MQSEIVVHKFGGAALADAGAIRAVGNLVSRERTSAARVIVTSALLDVTNILTAVIAHTSAGSRDAARGLVRELNDRHGRVIDQLLDGDEREHRIVSAACVRRGEELLDALELIGETAGSSALSDRVLAYGERMAADIVAAHLRTIGVSSDVVDAADLIVTDSRHGNASPDLAATTQRVRGALLPMLVGRAVVVVPGFIGSSPDGQVTTLGRGGSDLSAAVLARAVGAGEVVLWKDVPGFMTADPRIVPNARVVATLDAREASELAYYGAKVLHPRTLLPLAAGTTLRLRPFADPEAQGTRIVSGRAARGAPVRALSGAHKQAMIGVNGTGMLGVPGVAARVFGMLATQGISVSLISQASSEQSICFTVPTERAVEVARLLRDEFKEELTRGEVEEITVLPSLTTIAVVGSGMANTPGIAARIFNAVATEGVNVVAIAQGASERNVSFVVSEAQAATAMRAVHDAFALGKVGGGKAGVRRSHADIILLGAGRVAQELMAQLAVLQQERRIAARLVGVIDRSGFVFRPRGFTTRQIDDVRRAKARGDSLGSLRDGRSGSTREAVEHMMSHALSRPILVDVASGNTGDALQVAAAHGAHIVLANKVPLTASKQDVNSLFHATRIRGRRLLHEATVGAGLPVIDTLLQLTAASDRIDSVECSPSGTMGFLFSEMERGVSFSMAVREAMRRGYTEPDPRDDLSGLDVARKALILARMLGYEGELSDVSLDSLVPDELRDVSREAFLEKLPSLDADWAARIAQARERGEVVRYRARATRARVRVGLTSVSSSHPLASLDGTDNLFVVSTSRYKTRPLVISGPGAGTAVTAAGVLGDVLRLVGS